MAYDIFSSWFGQGAFFAQPLGMVIVSLILIWTLVWKALALWRAARKGSEWWFIALMIINTLGILEILYIYVFSKPAAAVGAATVTAKSLSEGEQKM